MGAFESCSKKKNPKEMSVMGLNGRRIPSRGYVQVPGMVHGVIFVAVGS